MEEKPQVEAEQHQHWGAAGRMAQAGGKPADIQGEKGQLEAAAAHVGRQELHLLRAEGEHLAEVEAVQAQEEHPEEAEQKQVGGEGQQQQLEGAADVQYGEYLGSLEQKDKQLKLVYAGEGSEALAERQH